MLEIDFLHLGLVLFMPKLSLMGFSAPERCDFYSRLDLRMKNFVVTSFSCIRLMHTGRGKLRKGLLDLFGA